MSVSREGAMSAPSVLVLSTEIFAVDLVYYTKRPSSASWMTAWSLLFVVTATETRSKLSYRGGTARCVVSVEI